MKAVAAQDMAALLAKGGSTLMEIESPPKFSRGDRVRTRCMHPSGHTRLPRYARGRSGRIHRHHGAHVFPDANAAGNGKQPQHLYSVEFDAAELWGAQAEGRGQVYLDLWESYLETQ